MGVRTSHSTHRVGRSCTRGRAARSAAASRRGRIAVSELRSGGRRGMQAWARDGGGTAPRSVSPTRLDVEHLQSVLRRAVEVTPDGDDSDLLGLEASPPITLRVAGEVGVGDGIAAPGSAHLDEQPAADLRGGGEHRLVAVAGGDGALELNHESRLRWPADVVPPTRDESSSEPPSVAPENGSFDSRIPATNGVHSVGNRSRRSPRWRLCLPSAAGPVSSHNNGPGVTETVWSRSTVAGWRIRTRVWGCRRHTSAATARRTRSSVRWSASVARASSGRVRPDGVAAAETAERQAVGEGRSCRHVIDHVAQHAVPRERHDPDRQVDRFGVLRLGGMRKAPRDGEAVARLEHAVDDHRAEFVG